MESLPDEVLLKIFEYLHQPTLLEVCQVSDSWAKVSLDPSLWKTVDVSWNLSNDKKDLSNIELFLMNIFDFDLGSSISKFLVDEVVCQRLNASKLLKRINVQCNNLKHLQVKTVCDIKLISNLFSKLENLELAVSPLDKNGRLFSNFSNLRSLHINVVYHIFHQNEFEDGIDDFLEGICQIPLLEVLVVERSQGGLKKISKAAQQGKLPLLQRLSLRIIMHFELEDVLSIAAHLKNLICFEIDNSLDIMDEISDIFRVASTKYKHINFITRPLNH